MRRVLHIARVWNLSYALAHLRKLRELDGTAASTKEKSDD